MTKPLAIILASIVASASHATNDVEDAIRHGIAVSKSVSQFTAQDVPDKFTSVVTTNESDHGTAIVHTRGGNRVLTVSWKTTWTKPRSPVFTAEVYDGTNEIYRIAGLADSTSLMKGPQFRAYDVITSLKTNGEFSLLVTDTNGFVECVIIDGRDTHLMNDLDYTRSSVIMNEGLRPLFDTITATNRQKGDEQGKAFGK